MDDALATKVVRLHEHLDSLSSVVVAFSGGADSAYLARCATDVLGRRNALCLTAVSPSLDADELDDCRSIAAEWALAWETVETFEMDRPEYVSNGGDRCYHCKDELMSALVPRAESIGATVVLGVNTDDLSDHRPGQHAARSRGALFPLADAGFSKADVRAASRDLGLRTWDKPAAPCLSSRIPYGTPVSLEALSRVSRAESGLRKLGFRHVRVRHYGDTARIEFDASELDVAVSRREEVVVTVKSAGFTYVTVDLEGFRSGNLNRALAGGVTGGVTGAVVPAGPAGDRP